MRLVCSACGADVPADPLGRSPCCRAIREPRYSDASLAQLAGITPGPGIDRYRALLPVSRPLVSLGEGDTPLLRSRRLGAVLGVPELYFKVEGRNPTGAFKDRAAAVATTWALESGAPGVLTASSGNAASAIATYCAAAGLPCSILLEPGNPPDKLRAALAAGASVLPIEGLFSRGPDALSELLREEAARRGDALAFVWAPVNAYLLEGLKTIAYETAARLPGGPDVVVCPVGGGDLLAAQWRGWRELCSAGVVGRAPRLIAVQSTAAAPLVAAYESGARDVTVLASAASRLSGINVAFTGEHALTAVRESDGAAVAVEDAAALEMTRRLAREEGLWVEPAAAAGVAALPALRKAGLVREGERVVCVLTSAGYKDPEGARGQP